MPCHPIQEDEDFGKTPGVCIVCWCPTANIDASQVSVSVSVSGSGSCGSAASRVRENAYSVLLWPGRFVFFAALDRTPPAAAAPPADSVLCFV